MDAPWRPPISESDGPVSAPSAPLSSVAGEGGINGGVAASGA